MIDYTGFAFPKGPSRRDEKLVKQAQAEKDDRVARDDAWKRCKGKCEDCGRRIVRTGDLIHGAHFHHRLRKSAGGRALPLYRVLCGNCHFPGPSGAHTRSR